MDMQTESLKSPFYCRLVLWPVRVFDRFIASLQVIVRASLCFVVGLLVTLVLKVDE